MTRCTVMSHSVLCKCLALVVGALIVAGCDSGTQPAKSSLDNMSEAEKSAQIQKTFDQSMEKNQEAMKMQGVDAAPSGANPTGGFQPPESMKKYMNKQGGGGTPSTPPSSNP